MDSEAVNPSLPFPAFRDILKLLLCWAAVPHFASCPWPSGSPVRGEHNQNSRWYFQGDTCRAPR